MQKLHENSIFHMEYSIFLNIYAETSRILYIHEEYCIFMQNITMDRKKMQKEVVKTRSKVLNIICALVITGVFGIMSGFFIKDNPQSIKTLALGLLLFAFGLALSVIWVAATFRSYLLYGEDGIEYCNGFSKPKRISLDELQSVNTNDYYIFVYYQKPGFIKPKSFRISISINNISAFYEWILGKTENPILNQQIENVNEEIEDFRYNRYDNLTEDEQVILLRRASLTVKILWYAALLTGATCIASLFFINKIPFPLFRISLIACLAFPLLLFAVMKISKGLIRFNTANITIYPSVISVFSIISAVMLILFMIYIDDFIGSMNILYWIAAVDIALFILYMLCADSEELKGSGKPLGKITNILALLILFTFFSTGAVFCCNKEFDSSAPEIIETKVIDHKVSHGKHTSYYLTVSPWIDGKTESKKISVSSKAYRECQVGGTAYIHLYNGALGINWYYVSKK